MPSVSARVAAALGTPSVAEAAALAEGGTLLVPKTVRGPVTVAVAVAAP
ncbi:cobalamin biosynthesis protein [Klenkia sp. PcliD-1-E]|nr:cobalamin biosynthesis protein [Klenkia sp. PcliD-1-E]